MGMRHGIEAFARMRVPHLSIARQSLVATMRKCSLLNLRCEVGRSSNGILRVGRESGLPDSALVTKKCTYPCGPIQDHASLTWPHMNSPVSCNTISQHRIVIYLQ